MPAHGLSFRFDETNLPAATFAVFSMLFFAQANPRPLFGLARPTESCKQDIYLKQWRKIKSYMGLCFVGLAGHRTTIIFSLVSPFGSGTLMGRCHLMIQ
jgi:hypothetical protein